MRVSLYSLLVCCGLIAFAAGATDFGGNDSDAVVLRDRAERPAEVVAGRGGLESVSVTDRLFFMRAVEHVRCVRAIGDINDDDKPEVIATIDESQSDNIFCLDGSSSGEATVLWSILPISGVSNGSPYSEESVVPVSDSDDNGFQNLLVGTAWGGRSAHNVDGFAGDILWTMDTYAEPDSGWVYSLAEVSNPNGDLVREAAFGTGSENDSVYLIDGTSLGPATVIWRYPAGDAVYSVRNIGDVNGDFADDVLAAVGDDVDRLLCLDGGTSNFNGHLLWTYNPQASVYSCGVLPDITGDGIYEALVVLWSGGGGSNVRCVNGATGTPIWASTDVFEPGMAVDTLDDVTGDGVPEVIVSSWENAVIVLDGATGELVWKTTVGTTNGGDVWTARAIDDLDGDGFVDVIAGSFDTFAYAMNGVDGHFIWTFSTGYRVYSIYPAGDLNDDGFPEVVVGNQNLNGANNIVVHVLNGGFVVVFDDGFDGGDAEGWSATFP